MTGETAGQYVRRLQLEKAANSLIKTQKSITEIALVSYDTPAAFTKAFKRQFHISPKSYRKTQKPVIFTSIQFPKNRDENSLNPTLKKIREIPVLFVRENGPYRQAAELAWTRLMQWAYSNNCMTSKTQLMGISHDNPNITDEKNLRYDACISYDTRKKPVKSIGEKTILGGLYAVFLHRGRLNNISKSLNYIYGIWLPQSGYALRDCPNFDLYLNRDPRRTNPENLKTNIYIPIGKEYL